MLSRPFSMRAIRRAFRATQYEPPRERIAKAVIAKVSTYEEDGSVRIPGVARCIVGTK